MGSKRGIKMATATRPAGMQAMGLALYEQIRQFVAQPSFDMGGVRGPVQQG